MITKKENGYFVDVSLGIDPISGKQRRKRLTVSTKKEAQQIESKYLRLYHENKLTTNSDLTLKDIYEIYEEKYTQNLKPSYKQTQERIFKNYIEPYFKNTQIKLIKKQQIYDFQQFLLTSKPKRKETLSNKTINMIIIHLQKLFNVAMKEGLSYENPCNQIDKLKVQKKEIDFWTLDEFTTFISHIDKNKPFLKVFYQFAFFTGMRAGEMIALTWSDIDFYNQTVRINKSAKLINGNYVTTTPKTESSNRYITINTKITSMLKKWQEIQPKLLIDNFQNIDSDKLLVFQYNEKHPSSDYYSKQIKKIIAKNDLNLKPIRLHDFRHSHVALLIHNNEKNTTIKERLGHSSITTTIDTYGHLYPNSQKSMSDKFDNYDIFEL
ncbi:MULTISPECIES: tyrosine-type recombinase/integrase [Enterococcus]|uniref:tyrosine-type recombinase/integrase n=1 Tax=Enterococcus TaxID=1350 RepID=UPI0003547AAD|nr:site-specific integrase [Enterococcus faecalis]EPH74709.1 site-specific recombinase, phage integrase family [Enterococcus faecalis 02-MB-P-10]MDB1588999.1 site-specific integrase [Enterococcus faecalis]MDB1596539.1 site-specific integrase [Enterococcus faecalis]MDB1604847.1 site-specific integrase [Enterococcus faecalis]MDB1607336.1 site-specific integrase [Enterococcus faecalis]